MTVVVKHTLRPLRRTKQSDVVRPDPVTDAHKKGFHDGFLAAIEQIESASFSIYGTENDNTETSMVVTRNSLVAILRDTHKRYAKELADAAGS